MDSGSGYIAEGAIQGGTVDSSDPLYVYILVTNALRRLGMSADEARRYAEAHQQHALDRAADAIEAEVWPHERPQCENEELHRLAEKVRSTPTGAPQT